MEVSTVSPIDQLKRLCRSCIDRWYDVGLLYITERESPDASMAICYKCPYLTEITMLTGNHPDQFYVSSRRIWFASCREERSDVPPMHGFNAFYSVGYRPQGEIKEAGKT